MYRFLKQIYRVTEFFDCDVTFFKTDIEIYRVTELFGRRRNSCGTLYCMVYKTKRCN